MDVKHTVTPVTDGWERMGDAVGATRRAMRDRKARLAMRDAYEQARRLYEDLAHAPTRENLGRMARDQSLQEEIAAMIRSASHAVDAGAKALRKRRRRRVLMALSIVGGAAGLIAALRARRQPSYPVPTETPNGNAASIRETPMTSATA